MGLSKFLKNFQETSMFFLHLLMMTPALLSFSSQNEFFHCLKNLVHSSQMLVHKMLAIDLQKPMISFVFFKCPVSSLKALSQRFCVFSFFLCLFFRRLVRCKFLWLRFWRVTGSIRDRVYFLLGEASLNDLVIRRLSVTMMF